MYANHSLDVLWIEANSEVFPVLQAAISSYPRQKAISHLVTDQAGQEVTFKIANNDGQSSSIFNLAEHKKMWPEIEYCSEQKHITTTIDALCEAGEIDPALYDVMVLDVQGAELMVLKGAAKSLRHIRFIRLEAADFNAYEGAPTREVISGYLKSCGYDEIQADPFEHKEGLGTYFDVTFCRKGMAPR